MRKIIPLLFLLAAVSCSPEKKITISPKAEIHFGKSGGIANAKSEFIITMDGKLYQSMNDGPRKLVTDLGAKKAAAVMQDAIELGLDKLDFKHPGNMTSFIIINDGSATNEVDWGDPNNTPSSDVKSFYEKLFELRP